jgi:predicted flap endonuclease-1-like 5' DNA nuclease
MSSFNQPVSRFNIEIKPASGGSAADTRITVYDGWDEVRGEGEGRVDLQLPKGLYTVRAERAGMSWEKVIRHETVTTKRLQEPVRVSATPMFDTSTHHEYYIGPAGSSSRQDTRPAIDGNNGRLFIFLRAFSQENYHGENLAENLCLLDDRGQVVSEFSLDETHRDVSGSLGFSAPARQGTYLLQYRGEPPREMPLYVYPGLATQLFLMYQGGLRFETAKIFMPYVSQGFDPSDRDTQVVDAAVTTLQQGREFFPKDATDYLLSGKFSDPMLGLLGAHFLLKWPELRENYFHLVLDNLENLIPGSPDVQALRLMAAERLGWDIPQTPFDRAPMLRPALEAVLRLSSDYPELTPEKGLLECIATRFYVDSLWTSWELAKVCEPGLRASGMMAEELFAPDWLTAYLKETVQARIRRGRDIDFKELARQAGVPVTLISSVYERLGGSQLIDQFSDRGDDFLKISGIGPAIETLLKDMGIKTYGDLAQMGPEKVEEVSSRLGRFASRLDKHDWIGQAKKLLSE